MSFERMCVGNASTAPTYRINGPIAVHSTTMLYANRSDATIVPLVRTFAPNRFSVNADDSAVSSLMEWMNAEPNSWKYSATAPPRITIIDVIVNAFFSMGLLFICIVGPCPYSSTA